MKLLAPLLLCCACVPSSPSTRDEPVPAPSVDMAPPIDRATPSPPVTGTESVGANEAPTGAEFDADLFAPGEQAASAQTSAPATTPSVPTPRCDLGGISASLCAFVHGGQTDAVLPPPTPTGSTVTATPAAAGSAWCEGAVTVTSSYEELPWTKIWAVPADAIASRCACENTEVLLEVLASRIDHNLFCGFHCDAGYASCSRAAFCGGGCDAGTRCGFDAYPRLTRLRAMKRVQGQWSDVLRRCSFASKFYRDELQPLGADGKGAIISASAYDKRTGARFPVVIGHRSNALDGHAPSDPQRCCD